MGVEYTYKLLVQGVEIVGHSRFYLDAATDDIEAKIRDGIIKYWPDARDIRIKILTAARRRMLATSNA